MRLGNSCAQKFGSIYKAYMDGKTSNNEFLTCSMFMRQYKVKQQKSR